MNTVKKISVMILVAVSALVFNSTDANAFGNSGGLSLIHI